MSEQSPSGKKKENIEIPIIPNPEDAIDQKHVREILGSEGTPKEWREKLRWLIMGAKDPSGMSERGERSKEYLAGRSEELDVEAKKLGLVERYFRSLGEKYDTLGWKTKLAVGISLGLGAAAFSSVSLPATLAFMSGLGVQRIAGMASVFLKTEKYLQKKSGGFFARKEVAMLGAMLYTAGMGYAIKEAVQLASESSWGEAVHEWLKQQYPFGHAEVATQTRSTTLATPEVSEPAAVVSAPTPEMPSVEASTGHGYEYMAKRLWEQLQEKGLDPSQYAEGSDIRRLLEADASSIDKVVHQIAADPEHGFYNADGTSVRITLDSHMTINADGDLQLDGAVKASEGAPVTPSYPPAGDAQADAILQEASPPPSADISSETQAPPIIEKSFISNKFGLAIPVAEPHFYIDPGAKHLFVYGGSPLERANAIQEYLAEKPDAVVFSADDSGKYRIPWHFVGGKATPEAPVQTHGFLGFFKSFMKAPEPNEFEKSIK